MSIRRLIYSLVIYTLVPVFVIRLLLRSRKDPAFRRGLMERFGFVPDITNKPAIWLHAVSVGETLAAQPLINKLIEHYQDHHLLISNTTLTGYDTVTRLFGNRVKQAYAPYDLLGSLQRYLNHVQPQKVIIMETEIWPNLYAACHQRDIPIFLINARLSDRSVTSYLRFNKLIAETLACVQLIAARSEQDVQKFKKIGAQTEKVKAIGNIKFDVELPTKQIKTGQTFREQWGKGRLVWVAASTHQGEDKQVLAIHEKLIKIIPDLLLVIIPRHPERFDSVYQLAVNTSFQVQRRSQAHDFLTKTQVIIGDSMGEMFSWFAAADCVFMGGSLVETGGHNPLEPAALGIPVVSGPHIFNFAEVFPLLEDCGAAIVAKDKVNVEQQLLNFLQNTDQRKQAGDAGKATLAKHKGVVDSLLKTISDT